MSATISVAPLDLRDESTLTSLHALLLAAYRVEADIIGSATIPAMRETPATLRAAAERFLGARNSGEVLVGALSYRREGGTVDIHRVVVDPAAFRRGIASRMLADLERREPDAERFVVAAAAANAPACRLYETRGYVAIGERVAAGGVRLVDFERRRALRAETPPSG